MCIVACGLACWISTQMVVPSNPFCSNIFIVLNYECYRLLLLSLLCYFLSKLFLSTDFKLNLFDII
jgi:hypothetical protein